MLIAITGANGFVGNICKHLLDSGHAVRLIQKKRAPNVFYIEDIYSFDNWSNIRRRGRGYPLCFKSTLF